MKKEIVDKINNSPWMGYFAITGGGQTFIGDYLSISGASKTVVGAIVPYSPKMFEKFVGGQVDSYASQEAACKLAVAAFREAIDAQVDRKYAFGLGAACSLAKDNERQGRDHRIHVALHTSNTTMAWNVILKQGRTRQQEELLANQMIFNLLSEKIAGVFSPVEINDTESATYDEAENHAASLVLDGTLEMPLLLDKTLDLTNDSKNDIIAVYPGSWNPMHDSHKEIYRLASNILETKPYLELSLDNADKGQLDYIDLRERLKSVGKYPIILTNKPTFLAKAIMLKKHFPKKKIVFIMGADTWTRLWDCKYAGHPKDVEQYFKNLDIKFLVFGRGKRPIKHPEGYGESLRIIDVTAETYDVDMSSRDIRRGKIVKVA